MKLLCVVISFVFVNVSADIMAYKRVVSITNLIIQNASDRNDINGNGLEFLIKAIVYENQFSMEDMSILFAVPEKADLVNIQSNHIFMFYIYNTLLTFIVYLYRD
ncbi:uncharacterized protein LOC126835528 [Adelges cooleyi]|uniref:uncharacterized protein LOC126835528 n=1 Tax=Adelges cooleyi TaxID=133065 RepID=UPI0021807EF5|nr:uncharacterized protein LOC126835528 [Adelges cooleyi]